MTEVYDAYKDAAFLKRQMDYWIDQATGLSRQNETLIQSNAELLAALEALENYASLALTELSDRDTGWYYQLKSSSDKARAAIAKARQG